MRSLLLNSEYEKFMCSQVLTGASKVTLTSLCLEMGKEENNYLPLFIECRLAIVWEERKSDVEIAT